MIFAKIYEIQWQHEKCDQPIVFFFFCTNLKSKIVVIFFKNIS